MVILRTLSQVDEIQRIVEKAAALAYIRYKPGSGAKTKATYGRLLKQHLDEHAGVFDALIQRDLHR